MPTESLTLMGSPRRFTRPWWQHAVVAVIVGLVVWSTVEQHWLIAVISLNALAFVSMLLANISRGDHLSPSPWLPTGFIVVLALPLLASYLQHLWWAVFLAATGSTVVAFVTLRYAELRTLRRLATGDFYEHDLW